MPRLLHFGLALVLALSLSVALSCDDGDNGGGGPAPGATSSLAGEWELKWVVAPGAGLWGSMTVDASGNVTRYYSPLWLCGYKAFSRRVSGALVQEGDTITARIYHACAGWPANLTWLDIYQFNKVSADRLHGSIIVYLNKAPVIPKWAIIAIRR